MKKSLIFLISFTLIITVINLLYIVSSQAISIDKTCTKIESVFARGSGARLNDDEGEPIKFFDKVDSLLNNSTHLTQNKYELGTESYGGYQYPAVSISGWGNFTPIGASLSAGEYFAYGDSVKQGVGELNSYLTQRHDKCKSSDTRYILGGYSQGAQVIGQALSTLPREIRDKIVFVGLFGDPKLHLPEGEGWNPPACRGKDYSPWRRAVSNCHLDNGSLSARIPHLPDDMKNKTGTWCYKKDFVCDIGALGGMSGHSEYKNEGRAIDEAAREAVSKLGVDTPLVSGSGTTGTDMVFVIDTTGSMSDILEQTKQFARTAADEIVANNGRIALVEYRDKGDDFPARILSGFEDDYATFQLHLERLYADGGGDQPEAVLHALRVAFDGLNWKSGATKAAVVLTDASFHEPDRVDGSTVQAIIKRSLEIDPVNIYPVINEDHLSYYQNLADATSGQVILNTGDTAAALTTAITKIQERPVAFLKNTEYMAEPGQEITFDASDSYVIDAMITKYEWDFDGDGVFDAASTTPVMSHVYSEMFIGNMQVRLTATNNTVSNASAPVTVKTIIPTTLPAAPSNLTHKITKTENGKSTVVINWNTAPSNQIWYIGIDGNIVGFTQGDHPSLEITDIDRSKDVVISVAGGEEGIAEIGEASTVTVKAISKQSPIFSTCSQSNFIIKLLCKAIALAKVIINGTLYYILPWRV